MSIDAHKNFAYSTVATAPSPALSGTSLVVFAGDGTKFPAVAFNAVVWPAGVLPLTTNAEIVRVTVIATDTFTITRASEGPTGARTILAGDQIAACITAKTLTDIETAFAALASPAFTGTPTAPTAAPGTNTTQLATTAFVTAAQALDAPLASPAFTGGPTAPTPTAGNNTTALATTAFVQTALPVKPMLVLNRQAGAVANGTTVETTLKTFALAAGQLAVNGDTIRLEASGVRAANTNSVTLRFYFGATVVMLQVDTTAAHLIWRAWAEITRTGATAQIACGSFDSQVSGELLTDTAPAETLSGAITVKLTGQSAVQSSDVTAKNWVVLFLPNA